MFDKANLKFLSICLGPLISEHFYDNYMWNNNNNNNNNNLIFYIADFTLK